MRYIAYLTLFFLISCSNHPNTELPENTLYFKFSHIKEIVNSDNVTLRYELVDDSISSPERDTLMQILKELHYKYKISTEGDVLIQKLAIASLDNLNYVNGLLERRMNSSK